MRILSNLIVTGRIQGDGVLFIPKFSSEEALSGSFVSASLDRLGLYTDNDRVPKIIDSSSYGWPEESGSGGATPIACEPTNSVSVSGSLSNFYNCIVSSSRTGTVSDFNLDGTANDTANSEYSGSERRNYSTYGTDGAFPDRITHRSDISIGGAFYEDFTLDFASYGNRDANSLTVYVSNCNNQNSIEALKAVAERFKKLFCRCLRNGQYISFTTNIVCRDTGQSLSFGSIKFEKCFGNCSVSVGIVTGLSVNPKTDRNGNSVSVGGYSVPWASSVFNYILSAVTGSESQPSSSGELTASTTPYVVIPSAPVAPESYYDFAGSLSQSPVQYVSGLIYYNTVTSTLSIYDGSGSWNPITGSISGSSGLTRYTEQIGNEVASKFNVTHNKNTRDVMVTVRESSTPYEFVYPTVKAVTTDMVEIDFGVEVPTTNQYTVIVI